MNLLDFREPVSAWSHCAGMMLAVPGTYLLWRRSAGETSKRLTLLVYGLTLAFCYLASTLYHGVRLPESGIRAFARLDGVGIFAPHRGKLHPAGVVSAARPLAALDAGGCLERGRVSHRGDRGWPPLFAGAGDLSLPGDGLGRRDLLF